MKSLLRKAVVTLWVGTLTLLLTRHWYQKPDSFPPILRLFGNWIIDKTGVKGADQIGDMEILFVMSTALLITLITTWLVFLAIKIFAKRI